jgi:putative transposase
MRCGAFAPFRLNAWVVLPDHMHAVWTLPAGDDDFPRHFNPVKHGYVSHPADWPYSSFRARVAEGLYSPDWIGPDDGGADRGERSP